jgi:serine/threonine protein kinase
MQGESFDDSKEKSSQKKYKIIEKISEGQFGTVFRAINNETSKVF